MKPNVYTTNFDIYLNRKEARDAGCSPRKVFLDDTEYFICFSKPKSKKDSLPSYLKKSIAIRVSYLEVIGKNYGWWRENGRNHYLEIKQNQETYERTGRYESEECPEDEKVSSAERYFSPNPSIHIELSTKKILKEYGKSNAKLLLALIMLVLTFFVFFYLNTTGFFEDQLEKRRKPPQPNFPSLTNAEKTYLKHMATLEYLQKDLLSILKAYEENPELFERERRIEFSTSEYQEIAKVRATYNEDMNKWQYLNGDFPKRGGISISVTSMVLNSFLSKGTVYSGTSAIDGKSYFSRREGNNISLDERNITRGKKLVKEPPLSGWCLDEILHLGNLKTGGIKRGSNFIELKIEEANPREFLPHIYDIAKRCDGLFLYSTVVSGAKISSSMKMMYSMQGIKKQGDRNE